MRLVRTAALASSNGDNLAPRPKMNLPRLGLLPCLIIRILQQLQTKVVGISNLLCPANTVRYCILVQQADV